MMKGTFKRKCSEVWEPVIVNFIVIWAMYPGDSPFPSLEILTPLNQISV